MKISPLKNFDFAEKWHTPPNLCQFQCPHHNKTCFFGHPMDYPMPYFWTDPFSENKSHRLASFQNLVSDWVDLASINAMRSGWGLRPKPQVPNPTLCWVANSRVSPRKVPFRFIQVVFMLPSLNFANKFGSSPIEKFWYSISYQLSFSQIFWMKTHTNYPIYPDLSQSPFRPPVFGRTLPMTVRIRQHAANPGVHKKPGHWAAERCALCPLVTQRKPQAQLFSGCNRWCVLHDFQVSPFSIWGIATFQEFWGFPTGVPCSSSIHRFSINHPFIINRDTPLTMETVFRHPFSPASNRSLHNRSTVQTHSGARKDSVLWSNNGG